MTREQALEALISASNHTRLKAARLLARSAVPADIPVLRRARATETVTYVRSSLDLAIARLTNASAEPSTDEIADTEIPESVRRQIYARATEWISGLVLHEIASPIGLLALAASRDIPNFHASQTKNYLDSLQRTFSAVEQLKTASATPRPEEFDLARLLDEIIASEFATCGFDIGLQGPKPMLIVSDPALLRFAICNGIRNAVEAVGGPQAVEPHPVIITWGETDVDYWIAVLDRGAGIAGPVESVFGIGKSTKRGHSGFGLAIARAAIEALDGSVTLEPATSGGTSYELRWEK